jgi:decaprenylphospho-beta-D-ribofuranose 2-oxidase
MTLAASQAPDDAAGRAATGSRTTLSGWGRFPRVECRLLDPSRPAEASAIIPATPSLIARGNGRAYGDSALNPDATMVMRRIERLIDFDPDTGLLVCEAGVLLADLVSLFAPRGWFVPVTPGTRFVTVGGMVAADVHGKNHHVAGSFGRHVAWLDLALADGSVLRCSPSDHADVFRATVGGMGLTGVILRAAFRMVRIDSEMIRQTLMVAPSLDEAMDLLEAHASATYSVAWIDCLATGGQLGRSLIMLGEHALREEVPADQARAKAAPAHRVPFDFPRLAMNRWSIAAFNTLYYRRGKPGTRLVDLESYFYPLDAILDWNRIYGRGGFLQYQFVLPGAESRTGLREILTRIASKGLGSFLAVLKLFGPQDGLLSFPMEGYTLALDFPVSAESLNLMLELDRMVGHFGGRLYLAKDARAGARAGLQGYPNLDAFRHVRDRLDPHHRFRSLQSERLGL